MRLGISVARPNLVSVGTCFGKFSKSGKFKLHITALDYLAQYAKYKVLHSHHLAYFVCEAMPRRYGSNQMAKCPFSTETMSSKHIWDA